MKLFKFEEGRQKSGYRKMLLLTCRKFFKFDLYLMHYPEGSYVKKHVDSIGFGRHFRINLILKNAKEGGKFSCENYILNTRILKIFRPDENFHELSKIEKGSRYVLSFGFILKFKVEK